MRNLKQGDFGPDVMLLQSTLKKTGFYSSEITGDFDEATAQAVQNFQRASGLRVTGDFDAATYQQIEKYILGYALYTVKSEDTADTIAEKFGTTVKNIEAANPNTDIYSLSAGQELTVPYGTQVVYTDIDYTYDVLELNIRGLKARYPFLEVGVAGYSLLGKNLYLIRIGGGKNEVFYNAAHHALEWITTPVLMKFIEDFASTYVNGEDLSWGYDPQRIWKGSTIYIMPMVNPDGVDIVLNGISRDNPYYNDLIKWNGGNMDFGNTWQANSRGVDLNHNYNAGWETYKEIEAEIGITGPGPTRYAGTSPESEPETKTVADFTRNRNFRLVLAYHSQGEVIYWNFMNLNPPDGEYIGRALASASGYSLETATGPAAYSGFDDWFTKEFNKPGYTIEVGRGKNPLPISQFDEIYADNLELLLLAAII